MYIIVYPTQDIPGYFPSSIAPLYLHGVPVIPYTRTEVNTCERETSISGHMTYITLHCLIIALEASVNKHIR